MTQQSSLHVTQANYNSFDFDVTKQEGIVPTATDGSTPRPLKAIIVVVVAHAMYAVGAIYLDIGSSSVWEFLFWKGLVQFVAALLTLKIRKLPILPTLLGRCLALGFLVLGYVLLAMYSLTVLPIGDASVLYECVPLYTFLIGLPLGRVKCSRIGACTVTAAIVGIVVLLQPEFLFGTTTPDDTLGILCAIMAGLCLTGWILGIEKYGVDIINYHHILSAGFFYWFAPVVAFFINWTYIDFGKDPIEWLYIAIHAFTWGLAMFLTIEPYQILDPVLSSLLSMSEPVFAYMCSFLLSREEINGWSLCGGLILITSCSVHIIYAPNRPGQELIKGPIKVDELELTIRKFIINN